MGILEELSAPDKDGIMWLKRKSEQGNDFEIGQKWSEVLASVEALNDHVEGKAGDVAPLKAVDAGDQDEARIANANTESLAGRWISVYWPVGNDEWKNTSQDVKDIGISRYRLHFNGHPNFYDYTLDFTNTKGWGFDFKGESGDVYPITTVWNTDHYIKYDSKKPTIIAVREQ